MAAPKIGTVVDGYRFTGGNPNDENAWVVVGERSTEQAKTDAQWLDNLRSEARAARQVVPLANQFLGYNQEAGTGGIGTALGGGFGPIPALDRRPARQAMEGLTSSMMRATMVPGQSRSMDSNKEMQFAIERLPNINAKGDVNTDRVKEIQREAFMKAAQLRAAERYIAEQGVPDGFEAYWAKLEPIVAKSFKFQRPPPLKVGKGVSNDTLKAKSAATEGYKVLGAED